MDEYTNKKKKKRTHQPNTLYNFGVKRHIYKVHLQDLLRRFGLGSS